VLHAIAIDTDGSQQNQIGFNLNAVDLDHYQIQFGQVRRHPFAHPHRRKRHKPPRYGRLRHARAVRGWNVALR
jgi:hypothetical protein